MKTQTLRKMIEVDEDMKKEILEGIDLSMALKANQMLRNKGILEKDILDDERR